MKNQEGQTPYDLTTADDVKSLIEAAMPHHVSVPVISSPGGDSLSSHSKTGSVSRRIISACLGPPSLPVTRDCSALSDGGSDTSSVHDMSSSQSFIDYGSTPGGQGDGSLDREKAEGEVTLRDMSVSSFLDEVRILDILPVSRSMTR